MSRRRTPAARAQSAPPGAEKGPVPRTCETCPAWSKTVDVRTGAEVLVPIRNDDGTPATENGQPLYRKDAHGRLVRDGACCAELKFNETRGLSFFPNALSCWWCVKHPERRAAWQG